MKKLAVVFLTIILLTGCTKESSYNEQVDKYELLITEEASKVIVELDDEKASTLRDSMKIIDDQVKSTEDKITVDGKISTEELETYTKLVNDMEVLINAYK